MKRSGVIYDTMSLPDRLKQNNNLLSLPQVLSEVLNEVGQESYSLERLGQIILKDPSLTSRVLRIANSPFYHRFARIRTVSQAITILGATTVKCIALSSSIFRPDKIAAESGVDPRDFLLSCMASAAAAEKIAVVTDQKAPEEAFIAGLLLDIGTLFFLHHHPIEYRQVTELGRSGYSLISAERKVFGVDHIDVGVCLTQMLGLPDYIPSAIQSHHDRVDLEGKSHFQLTLTLAALIGGDRFSGIEPDLEQQLDSIRRLSSQLQLDKEQIDEVTFSLLPGAVDAAEYVGIDVGDIQHLLMKANKEIWKTFFVLENLFKERQELSQTLLEEERNRGALETKTIAMATLSHYLNNTAMAIYGRSQLMRMLYEGGNSDKLLDKLPSYLDIIDNAVRKTVAVIQEMRAISPIDNKKFLDTSKALNIDERIDARMKELADGFNLRLSEAIPETVE